jgi:chromosome segregation ATPase
MAGRDNTTRIELLEERTHNLSGRLEVLDVQLQRMTETLKKGVEDASAHTQKIIVIEQQLLALADLKEARGSITAIREELVAIKKDVQGLSDWKAEVKREKEESSRRKWAFGPNITAALISGVIALLGVLLNYFLNRPS